MGRTRNSAYATPVGEPLAGNEGIARAAATVSSRGLLRRQLVFGQHGLVDPAAYADAARLAGFSA